MSKPTLQERAAAYLRDAMGGSDGHWSSVEAQNEWISLHLAEFAAQEVARVQREAVDACDAVLGPLSNGGARNAVKAVRARLVHASLPRLDDVLRERGLKHVGFVEKGGVVTDVNHKPVKHPGLFALAKAAKKGKRP